jgi:hypothetical protein
LYWWRNRDNIFGCRGVDPVLQQKRIQRSLVSDPTRPWPAMMGRGFLLALRPIPSWLKLLGNCVAGVLQRARNRPEPHGPVSGASMINTCRLGTGASCGWKVIQSFITKSGCQSSALVATSSSASGISRRKLTHTSTSIWAMPARLSAPLAPRYSDRRITAGRTSRRISRNGWISRKWNTSAAPLSPADPGQDRALASGAQERHPARALLPAATSNARSRPSWRNTTMPAITRAWAISRRPTSTSDEPRPSSSNAKGSSARQSQTVLAASTACRIVSITDDPAPPLREPAICLKSSDDGQSPIARLLSGRCGRRSWHRLRQVP